MNANQVLAATFSWDVSEAKECRYQDTRTKCPIYSVGDKYYAVSKTEPKDKVGGPWRQHNDQYFAGKKNTVVWVCDMLTEAT